MPNSPHPRRQHRRDIHDMLTRRDELLRQQIAEPTCGLDRPRPRRVIELRRPTPSSSRDLTRAGLHEPLANTTSSSSIATAVCVRLCGSIPIITITASDSQDERGPRWALLIRDDRAADLFRATPRQNPAAAQLVSKANPTSERQAVREQRPLDSTDATNNAATPPPTQSGRSGATVGSIGWLRQCRAMAQLIAVFGASPGIGKTTLTRAHAE